LTRLPHPCDHYGLGLRDPCARVRFPLGSLGPRYPPTSVGWTMDATASTSGWRQAPQAEAEAEAACHSCGVMSLSPERVFPVYCTFLCLFGPFCVWCPLFLCASVFLCFFLSVVVQYTVPCRRPYVCPAPNIQAVIVVFSTLRYSFHSALSESFFVNGSDAGIAHPSRLADRG